MLDLCLNLNLSLNLPSPVGPQPVQLVEVKVEAVGSTWTNL